MWTSCLMLILVYHGGCGEAEAKGDGLLPDCFHIVA